MSEEKVVPFKPTPVEPQTSSALVPMDWAGLLTEPDTPPDWLFAHLLERGDNVFNFGDGGTGKTYVALSLAVAGVAGLPAFGHERFASPRPLRVLYVDEEMRPEKVRRRVRRLALGLKVTEAQLAAGLFLWNRSGFLLSDTSTVKWLINEVKNRQADLVIVDSFVQVNDADENDAAEIRKLLTNSATRLQNETRVGMLLTDHTRKENDRDRAGADYSMAQRGSRHKRNHFETVWSLRSEPAQDVVRVKFAVEKGRDVAPGGKAKPFYLEFKDLSNGSIVIKYAGEVEEDKAESAKLADSIRDYADINRSTVMRSGELQEAVAPKSGRSTWKRAVNMARFNGWVRATDKKGYVTLLGTAP